jgi:SAM-dependent methyltransferase
MFENLVWKHDRMLLDELVFRLEPFQDQNWNLGDNCFRFYKMKGMIDEYARLWSCKSGFHPENILELGIWDGGSTAMWFECLRPKKLVAIDIKTKGDSEYFRQYVASKGLKNRIKTYWGTDQADSDSLRAIVAREYTGSLDLVIDDASHLYEPTKASFETLFPLLRPGGLYVIEDWAWGHWEGFDVGPMGSELTQLLFELIEARGSRTGLISDIGVFHNFVVVERGDVEVTEPEAFRIHKQIYRRPQMPAPASDLIQALRSQLVTAGSEIATIRSKLKWNQRALLAVKEINSLIPTASTVLLVDDQQLGDSYFPAHTVVPFPEREGQYWGPPADDQSAVRELERLRQLGASSVVFAFPAFWWLDYYAGFHSYLRENHRCLLENDRLVAFDLQTGA